jgi:predicted ATPase/class 3 adenylate cyclase
MGESPRDLPAGTVTFVFTDIEGSTRLLQALGDRWQAVLEDHNRLLRGAIREAGGLDLRTEGDAFFAVFRSAPEAVAATAAGQRALAGHRWPPEAPIRVRMGVHTGEGTVGGDDYVGLDVHRAARIAATGHGGQVLVSSATAELVRAGLPDGVGLRDLGQHRLKDLARPERLYQLTIHGLPAEFPHIRSLETPTNLPTQRTGFVGREREVARVKDLLRGPGLLTLTGAGGSGKTRLALEAAGELLETYPDGLFLVELAAITDPRLVASAIAETIGVRAEGPRQILDALRDHLRGREMLLVLDNFEQVLDGAVTVAELLVASSRLRVLATSREPLHLAGEQEFDVPPMALPDARDAADPKDLIRREAAALFVQRARAVDPGFSLTEANAPAVAELCIRLDGLPLAIELAASRIKMLSPRAILDRIEHRLELLTGGSRDLPARQRTLREAIAWSHDLLEEAERTLFRRLAVFAGGWTFDAAEAVANPAGELGADVLGIMASLFDKSLVRRAPHGDEEPRAGMLESIREFGMERLDASLETEATRDRHLAYFLSFVETAEPELRRTEQTRWLNRLEQEHDNIRAALRRAIDSRDAGTGLRLIAALWRFWHLHSHLAEGRGWIEEVLALPGAARRTAERARGLTALGGVTYWQEDLPAYREAYEEALAIARELGDRTAEAEGLYNLGFAAAMDQDFPGAVALWERSKAMFEELGDRRGLGDAQWVLGIAARLAGDLPGSRALAEQSLELHREAGDRFGVSIGLYALGRTSLALGDLSTAESSMLEALDIDEAVGSRTGMGVIFDNLAAQAAARGDHLRALRLGGASAALKEVARGQAPPPLIDLPDPREAAREALGEAAVAAAWEEGRAMTLEQALGYARQEE